MQTYISILRGINVGGNKIIKMKSLKEMYENLGFKNVRTFIQSGNVIFGSNIDDIKKSEKIISDGILKTFGFTVPVIVLDKEELRKVSEQNYFIIKRKEDVSKLAVTFLSEKPGKELIESIKNEDYMPDEFYIIDKAVYLFCPGGFGNSKLNINLFEKKLKVIATSRNWNTVLELLKISNVNFEQ